MDYYKLGDLDKALKQKRQNKGAVDEIVSRRIKCLHVSQLSKD
jgi:hypothetical protein